MTPKPMNIMFGVLRERLGLWAFFDSLMYMQNFMIKEGIPWRTMNVRATNIYKGREHVAEQFMATEELTHLLFIDSDETFVPATAMHLASLDLPIVSGLVFQKQPPHLPCIYKRIGNTEDSLPLAIELKDWLDKHEVPVLGEPIILDEPSAEDSIWEIDECGTGCMMIRRDVFDAIPQPWFRGMQPVGTDLSFCRRAREHGVPIYVDLRVQLGHIVEYQVTQGDFRKTQKWKVAEKNYQEDE